MLEANAVTDNPLVFARGRRDGALRAATSTPSRSRSPPTRWRSRSPRSARIAERRIAMLIDAGVSRAAAVPRRSTAASTRGFMIAHVTAAALATENKSLAHPASVDSLPTSANQEDHVTMATFAARRLQPMIAQHRAHPRDRAARRGAGHRLPAPARAARPPLEAAHALLREQCAPMPTDRYLGPDIERATALVRDGALARVLRTVAGLPALWHPA